MRHRWLVAALLGVNVALGGVGAVHAQKYTFKVGMKVVTKHRSKLWVGGKLVDEEKHFRTYAVSAIRNGWVGVNSSSINGWMLASDLVPFDEAIVYYTQEIRQNPQSSWAYGCRGLIWNAKGEYDIAISDYNEAIRLDPSEETDWNNRGTAWADKHDYDKAIGDYSEAIGLAPSFAGAFYNRGAAWANKHDYDKAIADYTEAIRLDPTYISAFNNRGLAWANKHDYDKAIADYDEAIWLDPKYASAFNNRAWIWATCPDEKYRDGKEAVESATRACELSQWKDANKIGTLAAAYAEMGKFDKAVEYQEKAIKLHTDDEEKKKGEERLALYKDKKPYRNEKEE